METPGHLLARVRPGGAGAQHPDDGDGGGARRGGAGAHDGDDGV